MCWFIPGERIFVVGSDSALIIDGNQLVGNPYFYIIKHLLGDVSAVA